MVILGVDPGLAVTGYGVIETGFGRPRLVEGGVVRTDEKAPLEIRLASISAGIREVISACDPDVMVVEKIHSKYKHPGTAILMGHARGVICLAAAEMGLCMVSYTASQVKKSTTGNGDASKEQVQRMVKQLLGLPELPRPTDVADALALALCQADIAKRKAALMRA